MKTWLALVLALALGLPARAEERPRGPSAPFVGLAPLDPFAPQDRDPARLQRFADLGSLFVRTTPIAWGAVEPQPPRSGPPRYAWKALDEAVLVWQLSGFRPVLVLSPASRWGALPTAASPWARALEDGLPAAEAEAALRSATGAGPPRPGRWTHWERFVRDVVERYDGDGERDMPGLRAPVRHVQVLDGLEPASWLGDAAAYLRLLHTAGQAAKSASKATRILTATLDLRATGHAPHPDRREWDYRIARLVPAHARLARMEVARAFAHVRRILEMPRLYDAVAQRGSAHHADDIANLRFLRRHLDEQQGSQVALWLVDNPTRKLATPGVPATPGPKTDALRLRQRWLPAARNPAHPRHAEALAWMRRGQAFDLVRSVARSRAAGADVILFLAPWDTLPPERSPRAPAAGQGFLVSEPGDAPAAGLHPSPSYWALRQALRLLGEHRSAGETSIGAPGCSVVFRLEHEKTRPWVAVLMLDSRLSWAGTPGSPLPVRDVLVPLPSGRYVLEACRLGPEAPERKTIEVVEGMVKLSLTPAPVYVIPR